MHTFDFTDRTVFVAGGTSGINLGIAEAGARLAVISRSQVRVDTAKKLLSRFGREAIGFVADVRMLVQQRLALTCLRVCSQWNGEPTASGSIR